MNDNQLGQKVKALRKRQGFSQEALANSSGLSLRTVQRIENENKNPSGDSLKRISTALGVSPDYLLEWEPNENRHFLIILALSPLLCIINPFLAIIVPLILWSLKKNQIKGVKRLGVKVLTIQTVWIVLYFIFRTLNFLRIKYIVQNMQGFSGDQWGSFLTNVETQSYLKLFFVGVNILIILFMSYKTYRNMPLDNSKPTIQRSMMKRSLLLIVGVIGVIGVLVACFKNPESTLRQHIEPCEYHMMSFQVKNVSYHDSITCFLTDDSYISIIGDSTFNVTPELGQFLFNGTNFTYEVVEDSLILFNSSQRLSCKILDLTPNSFKLELDNKYFDQIHMIKPKDKRREITKTVNFEY